MVHRPLRIMRRLEAVLAARLRCRLALADVVLRKRYHPVRRLSEGVIMRIVCDFDGSVITEQPWDSDTPLVFMTDAMESLLALKRAGHTLILFSSRANRANREDWKLNPENVAKDAEGRFNVSRWYVQRQIHERRYQQMLDFVATELPGVFAYIDDGQQGKPDADLFIDDRGVRLYADALGTSWPNLVRLLGEVEIDG